MTSITQISTDLASRPYRTPLRVGEQIFFTLEFSDPITVDTTGGSPLLELGNGGAAIYNPARSSAQTMAFDYVVAWGDDIPDLLVTGLDLKGATLQTTSSGASIDLTGLARVPGTDTGIAIDTAPPSPPVITSAGGLTNHTVQMLSGTGNPGNVVHLYDNWIAPLGSGTVGVDGVWTVEVGLPEGQHTVSAIQIDPVGTASNGSNPVPYTIDTTAPDAPAIQSTGPNATAASRKISGVGEPGSTVQLLDDGTPLTTAAVNAEGHWSTLVKFAPGAHNLAAVGTDPAGNASSRSGAVTFAADASMPLRITSPGGYTNTATQTLSGTAELGTTIAISDRSGLLGTVEVGESQTWSFGISLQPGPNAIRATATDLGGATSVMTTAYTLADAGPATPSSIAFTAPASATSGYAQSASYAGPVSYLDHEYIWSGTGGVAISAAVPNVFVHGGSGDDALQVSSGSNVLDGGAGSNFLIGASGADGGTDTFFTDARGTNVTWSTLINFHRGDYATLWGFDPNVSTWHWEGIAGVEGFTGPTLRADVHGTGHIDASITFAGLTMAQAQNLQVASGTVGGSGYLLFANPGV